MVFSTFTVLCNHQNFPLLSYFLIVFSPFRPPSSLPPETNSLHSISVLFWLYQFWIPGINGPCDLCVSSFFGLFSAVFWGFTHSIACVSTFIFFYVWIIHCMDVSQFVYPYYLLIDGLACFHLLTVVTSAAINVYVHNCTCLKISLGYVPREKWSFNGRNVSEEWRYGMKRKTVKLTKYWLIRTC